MITPFIYQSVAVGASRVMLGAATGERVALYNRLIQVSKPIFCPFSPGILIIVNNG